MLLCLLSTKSLQQGIELFSANQNHVDFAFKTKKGIVWFSANDNYFVDYEELTAYKMELSGFL